MPTAAVSFWHDVRTHLSTPEQVDLQLEVASVGSRGLALMLDLAIRYGVFVVLFFLYGLATRFELISAEMNIGLKGFALLLIFVVFLSEWFYFALFEWLWNGQTPGKRLLRLRVIKADGSPVGWLESVLRNFTRPIDTAGPMALVGMGFIFFHPRAQRPGDLAARTLVIREVPIDWKSFLPESAPATISPTQTLSAAAAIPLAPHEVELLQRFRQRLPSLSESRRNDLAAQVRLALQPRTVGTELATSALSDLEWLAALSKRI